jgi:hypothetical protein
VAQVGRGQAFAAGDGHVGIPQHGLERHQDVPVDDAAGREDDDDLAPGAAQRG